MLSSLVRAITGPIVFRKKLPRDFGSQKILVTSRSDLRLLAPGLQWSGGDLFTVVRNYVKSGQVVWDIGSNLGILSFSAAQKAGPTGSVYSLEADPRYADLQGRSARKLLSSSAPVSVLSAAIADTIGLLELVIPKNGHTQNHLSVVDWNEADDFECSKQVVTITLDFLLNYWRHPDFVKIDVEGAEVLAIQGGQILFAEVRPIAYIECSRANRGILTQFFIEKDYSLFRVDENGAEHRVEEFVFNTLVKPN